MSKIKQKPTLSIALSALNEAHNLPMFLDSLLSQQSSNYTLERILIVNDGSTDNTAQIARQYQNKGIQLINHTQRTGKSSRLNEIYQTINSEFLIQTDADVILQHSKVIETIVDTFISNPQTMMCGGNPQPLPALTLIEKAINLTVWAYIPFRKLVRGGDNIFSVDGRILGYRKAFYKTIKVPDDMIANDAFTYFLALSKGLKYQYVENAIVLYRSPQTVKDQVKQNTRFLAAHLRMTKIFGDEITMQEYSLPTKMRYQVLLAQFIKSPIFAIVIFCINRYCAFQARQKEHTLTAKWKMADTTKVLHT